MSYRPYAIAVICSLCWLTWACEDDPEPKQVPTYVRFLGGEFGNAASDLAEKPTGGFFVLGTQTDPAGRRSGALYELDESGFFRNASEGGLISLEDPEREVLPARIVSLAVEDEDLERWAVLATFEAAELQTSVHLYFLEDGELSDPIRLFPATETREHAAVDMVFYPAQGTLVILSTMAEQQFSRFGNAAVSAYDVNAQRLLWQTEVPFFGEDNQPLNLLRGSGEVAVLSQSRDRLRYHEIDLSTGGLTGSYSFAKAVTESYAYGFRLSVNSPRITFCGAQTNDQVAAVKRVTIGQRQPDETQTLPAEDGGSAFAFGMDYSGGQLFFGSRETGGADMQTWWLPLPQEDLATGSGQTFGGSDNDRILRAIVCRDGRIGLLGEVELVDAQLIFFRKAEPSSLIR